MLNPIFPHSYSFDPAYGLNLAQLLSLTPPEPPADFADFWRDKYQAAIKLDPLPRLTATDQVLERHRVQLLHFSSTNGVNIGGWLLTPLTSEPGRAVIIGHGYGGRNAPDAPVGLDDAVVLFPCFRGMGLSPVAGLSAQPFRHVLHKIEQRDRYILGGCAEDIWLGVSALLTLFPKLADQISLIGVSFAGGVGALAAPWDARIKRLHIEIPSFGHQALRLTLPCIGSGESVRHYQQNHSFNVMETLAYYDAASAARFLTIPTLVAAARFDPAVPPPGQFAIYNAIPEPWRHLFILSAGHFDYPDKTTEELSLQKAVISFI